jgi:hypothetical protein
LNDERSNFSIGSAPGKRTQAVLPAASRTLQWMPNELC